MLRLQADLQQVRKGIAQLEGENPDEYNEKHQEELDILSRLSQARLNARNDIFERINSRGGMGQQHRDTQEIRLDWHALSAQNARDQVDEQIVPVLPVLKSLVIITGRGRHSRDGVSVLKQTLRIHIDTKH